MFKKIEKHGKLAIARVVSFFVPVRKIEPGDLARRRIERLLVIRQHNQMGDMLLAVPAFRGLRRRFPDARISLIAASINTDVMLNNPYIDEVLTYAKERNRLNLFRLLRFMVDLRKGRFDAVIVLNTVSFSVTSSLLALASGAALRIGSTGSPFGHDIAERLYHLVLPLPRETDLERMHESEHNLYPLSILGVDESDLSSILVPTEEDERECSRFIESNGLEAAGFIVVHPGAGKKQNIWPAVNFAGAARALEREFKLRTVMVTGPVDMEAGSAFERCYGGALPFVFRPGVGFLGALMRGARITLCNDTGIMHVAGAVRARCVAVFGPTDPSRWKPPVDCVVAVQSNDGRVESVPVEAVLERVRSLLGRDVTGERG